MQHGRKTSLLPSNEVICSPKKPAEEQDSAYKPGWTEQQPRRHSTEITARPGERALRGEAGAEAKKGRGWLGVLSALVP